MTAPASSAPTRMQAAVLHAPGEVTLHGAWNSFSAPFPGDEWRTAAAKLASGELAFEFMITHELPLSALPEMMRTLGERSTFSAKVLFVPTLDRAFLDQ